MLSSMIMILFALYNRIPEHVARIMLDDLMVSRDLLYQSNFLYPKNNICLNRYSITFSILYNPTPIYNKLKEDL